MNHHYTVVRSRRKTISLVVKHDGTLEVRAPLRYSARLLDDFVNQKSDWIRKAQMKTSNAIVFKNYTPEEYEKIKAITLMKAETFVRTYSGRKPSQLKIRKQKSVWGTCSSKGIITINSLAGVLPEHLFEYILIHELSHLEVMNHSVYFWNLVSYYIPDWKERRTELKNYKISK